MWIKIRPNYVVNLDKFRTIHLENGLLLARNGREFQVLSDGGDDRGQAMFHQIVDSLLMDLNLLDLSKYPFVEVQPLSGELIDDGAASAPH